MKIARIVLTASILLSVKSTLFCSEEKATSLTRNDSFDALRDGGPLNGWFSWTPDQLAQYTLDNCGNEYKGKEVRIGSKNTTSAWTTFGEKVDSLHKAQQFLATIDKSDVTLPQAATARSNEFIAIENQRIAAERQAKIEAVNNSFVALNQESKSLLKEYFAQKTVARATEKKAIRARYNDLCQAEINLFNRQCKATDTQTASQLKQNLQRLVAIKAAHNQEFSELKDQIAKMPFTSSEQTLSGKELAKTAAQYKYWTPKAANSYAEAVKGDK